MYTHIIGVDEAGRGPLAGPVAVGAVVMPRDFDWNLLPGVTDSKKLSPEKREALFGLARELQKEGKCDFRVSMVHAKTIDRIGISRAIALATARALRPLAVYGSLTTIKLDGLLKAPEEFVYQETIVRGDATEKEISLASILAKVTRDRYMVRLAKRPQFSPYGFELHKGYGTRMHREVLYEIGLSDMHRRSYCKGLLT